MFPNIAFILSLSFILFFNIIYCQNPSNRSPRALDDDTYDLLKLCIEKNEQIVLSKSSNAVSRRVFRLLKSGNYKLKKYVEPITKEEEVGIVISHNEMELIVPKKSEVISIISRFYNHFKGENCFKLSKRVSDLYVGISRERIQDWINHSRKHCEKNPIFSNKDKLKPVLAKEPFEALQVDLVDFTSFKSVSKNKRYSYVLAALDVFSRYLVLKPLVNKEALEVAIHLEKIFKIFGYPKRVQTDQGSEFKGEVKLALGRLGIKKIESSSYHPQSQGKIERSHGTWKRKLRFDIENTGDTKWSNSLDDYAFQYNTGAHRSLGYTSPFEVFFGRKHHALEKVGIEEVDLLEENLVDWSTRIHEIRSKADEKQKQAAEAMIKSHQSKHPSSVYNKGDEVVVKVALSGKKIKGKKKLISKGVVLEVKEGRYRIEYQNPSNGANKIDWFPVSAVTSRTKHEEKLKQAEASGNVPKETFKSTYHLDRTDRTDKLHESCENSLPEIIVHENIEISKGKKYMLRERRVSSYKTLDGDYKSFQKEIQQAIKESKSHAIQDTTRLSEILADRNLRIVDVPGDGNCFFYAVAHQLFGDISKHAEIRANAVEYVANHPEEFKEFLVESNIDAFLSSLVTNREWADNHAIQATANAYGLSIEIINSNQEQFGGSRIVSPLNDQESKRIVLGQIEQLHFVSTEIDAPFLPWDWGGYLSEDNINLINTCPIDGPLLWLLYLIHFHPHLKQILLYHKVNEVIQVFNFALQQLDSSAKLHWYQNVAGINFNIINSIVDFHGSEAQLFFEPLINSVLGKCEIVETCSNHRCVINAKKRRSTCLTLNKQITPFESRVQSVMTPVVLPCNICGERFLLTRSIETLPPLLILSNDHLNKNEIPPDRFSLQLFGNCLITYVLVFLSFKSIADHFVAYFRLNTNSNIWFDYDGLRKPLLILRSKIGDHVFKNIGFFVYIQENMVESINKVADPMIEPTRESETDTVWSSEDESILNKPVFTAKSAKLRMSSTYQRGKEVDDIFDGTEVWENFLSKNHAMIVNLIKESSDADRNPIMRVDFTGRNLLIGLSVMEKENPLFAKKYDHMTNSDFPKEFIANYVIRNFNKPFPLGKTGLDMSDYVLVNLLIAFEENNEM